MANISYVKLHDVLFVPDVGQLGPTLTATGVGSVKMTYDHGTSLLTITGINKQTKEGVLIDVPREMISHMVATKQ